MRNHKIWVLLLVLGLPVIQLSAQAQASLTNIKGVQTYTGSLSDGATYLIEVPQNWNGTLLLYSQGYMVEPVPAVVTVGPGGSADPLLRLYLLTHGYALAGSSASIGWRVHEAFSEQIEVLDTFNTLVGSPARTIAWGHSMGGLITAGLIQKYPERFSGALPMCSVAGGSVGTWNQWLDAAFAFKTLLAPGSGLQLVNITNPDASFSLAQEVLTAAQASPEGRARIALVAALTDLSGWFDPFSPEPSPTDYATQEANQFLVMQGFLLFAFFEMRAELEGRAGGNASWNTGVDYRQQLALSIDNAEVHALYEQAGLDLDADLDTLNNATRIAADPAALDYLSQNIIFNGQISVPVLMLHTTDDEALPVQHAQAYADVVAKASNSPLLRQLFVHRGGHCNLTEGEMIAALQTLIRRLDTGSWQDLDPEDLNTASARLGAVYNTLCVLCSEFAPPAGVPMAPAFVDYSPAPFLRPYDAFTSQ